jgi:hypothetical protein
MFKNLLFVTITLSATSCGVPKELVRQETITAFNNTAFLAAEVNALCKADGDPQHTDHANDVSRQAAKDKLKTACQRLDELSKKADGKGFDCDTWKTLDVGSGSGSDKKDDDKKDVGKASK